MSTKYEITCEATATIGERWRFDLPADWEKLSEDERQDAIPDAASAGECLNDWVIGDEQTREWDLDTLQVAEAGGMSTSDGLGVEADRAKRRLLPDGDTRRHQLVRMRIDWLCREGWDVQAGDYRRGEVTLTELLRRLNDEPDVVHQIATWLEEDAAEEAPQTTLEVPEGCTGAVMYDRQGRPSIQHDARTCPIHEDAPISDVAIGVFVQEFLKLDATAEEIGRAVRRLSV